MRDASRHKVTNLCRPATLKTGRRGNGHRVPRHTTITKASQA
ncbi:hypothetical protein GIW45_06815 [Pseudomonas congelans]|nr:hypothetical protein [Pseudomonas congelans]